jgi:hypothetical protein
MGGAQAGGNAGNADYVDADYKEVDDGQEINNNQRTG